MKEQFKKVQLTSSTATSNTTATFIVDTLGASRAVVDLWISHPQVTNAPAVLKLGQGATTSSFADITAFVAGGTGGFTAAAATTATTTTNVYRMDVDLRGKQRYLQLTYTPATGQGATALTANVSATLGRLALGGDTATKQGVNQLVEG